MRLNSVFLGALMVAPTCGAVASLDINTVPRQGHQHVLDSVPRHAVTVYEPSQLQVASTPDHYPLITPRGRVEVHDLWMHDSRRNARYETYAVYEPAQDAYAFDARMPELEDAAYEAADGREPMGQAARPGDATGAVQAAASYDSPGHAKIIDVGAELAESGRGHPGIMPVCHDPSNACGAKDVIAIRPVLAQAAQGREAVSRRPAAE